MARPTPGRSAARKGAEWRRSESTAGCCELGNQKHATNKCLNIDDIFKN